MSLIIGIDSGIVNTGVVGLEISPLLGGEKARVLPRVVVGLDEKATVQAIKDIVEASGMNPAAVYMEKYRPRAGLRESVPMVEFQGKFRNRTVAGVGIELVNNSGFKKIVTDEMLQALGVYNFPLRTNHHDLRAAARIAIYGALKDDKLNSGLYLTLKDIGVGNTRAIKHIF